jgi:hypothetical protein
MVCLRTYVRDYGGHGISYSECSSGGANKYRVESNGDDNSPLE